MLAAAATAGLTVSADGDRLVVRGPKAGTDLGRELIERKAEVFAHLTTLGWDTSAALSLMHTADAAVDRHGCRGVDPAIQAAAGRACESYQRRDLAALTRACDEVTALAAANLQQRTCEVTA